MSSCSRTCARRAERPPAIALGALLLAACASGGVGGDTRAKGELRRETTQLVETFARARLECARVDALHAEPIPAQRIAGLPAGATREHWIATGCERRAVFEVTFLPEPDGGTSVDVRPWGEVRDAGCPPDRTISSGPSGSLAERLARAGRHCL